MKVRLIPSTDALVEEVLAAVSPGLRTEPQFAAKLRQCLDIIQNELGYEVGMDVQVHGEMEKALKALRPKSN